MVLVCEWSAGYDGRVIRLTGSFGIGWNDHTIRRPVKLFRTLDTGFISLRSLNDIFNGGWKSLVSRAGDDQYNSRIL